jgi:hypothetical protein
VVVVVPATHCDVTSESGSSQTPSPAKIFSNHSSTVVAVQLEVPAPDWTDTSNCMRALAAPLTPSGDLGHPTFANVVRECRRALESLRERVTSQ